MNLKFFVYLTAQILLFSSCAGTPDTVFDSNPEEQYDVALEVLPLYVKATNDDSVIDVLEASVQEKMEELTATAVFRIEEVLEGEFTRIRRGGPSKLGQARQAIGRGNVLKVLTLDFNDPDEEVDKQWVSVAVANPLKRFEISDWEDPHQRPVRLYLRRIQEFPDSYILVASQVSQPQSSP